jgi:hypothetical protein
MNMTKSTKTQKWILGILLSLLVLVVGAVVISQQQAEHENKVLEVKNKADEYDNKLKDRLKDANVRYAELVIGSIGASTLKLCYAYGYPENRGSLSRRRLAECDKIIAEMAKADARFKAEEAKKDAAYDKAHPVK